MIIERVVDPSADLLDDLSSLLMDAVESGAGVSFMSDLSFDRAREWWSKVFAESSSKAVILAARDELGVVGTVQLQPSWAPNQPHRADVAKLIVHRRARGQGVARDLMRELERYAREEGFTLLLLDTCKDSVAERLYSSIGWTRVGVVPNFALNPDGSLCDTVFFYKQLTG
ncbi:MAG TPA: GNAT family N-acetyltransferase [Gemmatimonadaceae bacterium]|nr:GNAT family N-acetyltransferase [Gemmatimonadaceae bacterium]